MARAIEKWTDEEFEQKKRTTGRHHDGGGLYLDVKPDGSGAFWYFRYGFGGKPNQLHFGPLHSVTLRQARKRAAAARAQLAEKKDPKAERDAERTATRLAAIKRVTFTEAVEAVFAAKRPGWRSQKHANEWRQTLRVYAEPKLGKLPVGEVDTAPFYKSWSRYGIPRRSRRGACGSVSRTCWTRRRLAAGATARTRPVGAGIWRIFFLVSVMWRLSSITRRCHMATFLSSWRSCVRSRASLPTASNF